MQNMKYDKAAIFPAGELHFKLNLKELLIMLLHVRQMYDGRFSPWMSLCFTLHVREFSAAHLLLSAQSLIGIKVSRNEIRYEHRLSRSQSISCKSYPAVKMSGLQWFNDVYANIEYYEKGKYQEKNRPEERKSWFL